MLILTFTFLLSFEAAPLAVIQPGPLEILALAGPSQTTSVPELNNKHIITNVQW